MFTSELFLVQHMLLKNPSPAILKLFRLYIFLQTTYCTLAFKAEKCREEKLFSLNNLTSPLTSLLFQETKLHSGLQKVCLLCPLWIVVVTKHRNYDLWADFGKDKKFVKRFLVYQQRLCKEATASIHSVFWTSWNSFIFFRKSQSTWSLLALDPQRWSSDTLL